MENRVDYGMTNIKKTQQVINTIVYSGLLFVMMMQSFLFDGWTHWAEDAHFFVDSNGLLRIAFFLSCLATLLEMPISGPRALLAAVMIIIPRVFTITHQNFLLTEMVLLASLSNLNSKRKNMYVWLFVHVLYGVLLVWLGGKGHVVPVVSDIKTVLGIPTKASSFGMGHPNSLALYIMSTMIMLWVMLKKHFRWWMTFLLFYIGAAIVLYLTLCRTVCIIMCIFPIVSFIIELLLNKKQIKASKTVISIIPIIMMAITLGISVYFLHNPGKNMDMNFSMRFREFRFILSDYHLPFGSFGAITGVWVFYDNLYLMLIACCGYIPTIIVLGSCIAMLLYLISKKEMALLTVTVIFLFYGIMENAMIYFIYFFVPILAFADRRNTAPKSSDISDNEKANVNGGT